MRFGPGHVSRPYALMAEWLARRTLNTLVRVRFSVDAYQTLFSFFFLLEVITFFLFFFPLFQSQMIYQNKSEKLKDPLHFCGSSVSYS